jgi:hypothetical protein
MESVTLRGEDFKIIHNTLCDLRNLVARMDESMIKTQEFDRIIEGFQMGLKDAYAQDNSTFDRKMDYFSQFRAENSLTAIWSIYDIDEHGFLQDHPWQGAQQIFYHETSAPIKGPTWGDLYRAADLAIERSGDSHHIFIEGFYTYAEGDNSVLGLTTGS